MKNSLGDLMFAQPRRRWANNSPTLGQRPMFDRLHNRRRKRTDIHCSNVWSETVHNTENECSTKLIGQTNER